MRHIRTSEDADNDLEEIGAYTEVRWGRHKCDEYLNSIAECLGKLADNPHMGTQRPELGRGLYSWPHESYRIFYRFDDEFIYIGRILHSSMDVSCHLTVDY